MSRTKGVGVRGQGLGKKRTARSLAPSPSPLAPLASSNPPGGDPIDQVARDGGRGRAYRGGSLHRTNRGWQPAHHSEDSAIAESWDLLIRRTRDLARNDSVAVAVAGLMSDHIVGDGMATCASAEYADTYDDEFNDEADSLYEEWSERWACSSGQMSRAEMEQLIIRECVTAGECFEVREMIADDPRRPIPLTFKLVTAEQLDERQDWPAGGTRLECRRGIEFDRHGQPVAYHFYREHPFDFHAGHGSAWGESVRLPAERVRHYWHPRAISQGRGVSWLTTLMQPARDADTYLGSELTAGIVNSLFTVLHLRQQAGSGGLGFAGEGENTDSYGNEIMRLGKGTVVEGQVGDDIKVIDPKRPNQAAGVFVNLLWQYMSMGARCSYLRLTRDYSKTNYSSARAAHLDDEATFGPLRGWFARRVSIPVRREWTLMSAGLQKFRSLSAKQFAAQQSRYLRLAWYPDGRPQIDPLKEMDAIRERLAAGVTTLEREIAALYGSSWRRVLRQRKRELDYIAALGLPAPSWATAPAPRAGGYASDDMPGQHPAAVPLDDQDPEDDDELEDE